MTDRVLTDKEIEDATNFPTDGTPFGGIYYWPSWAEASVTVREKRHKILRALERAVLKRVAEIDIDSPVILHRGHEYVSVEECRERERKAAEWGAQLRADGFDGASVSEPMKDALNRRYPSLLPKTPPPLKLSTGEWRFSESPLHPCHWSCEDIWFTSPHIKTAADADALAAWLRQYRER